MVRALDLCSIIILFLFANFFSAETLANQCSFLSDKELTVWQKKIGIHPEKFFAQKTTALNHFLINNDLSARSKSQLYQVFNSFIQSDSVLKNLPESDNFGTSLSGPEKTARDYLVMQWLAERYLGLIRRVVYHPQLKIYRQQQLHADSLGSLTPVKIKELVETTCFEARLDPSQCDQKKMIKAKLQFYPQLFCQDNLDENLNGELDYYFFVNTSDKPLNSKVVEIRYGAEFLIHSSLHDMRQLNQQASSSEIRRLLEKWAFTSLQKKSSQLRQPANQNQ